MSNPFKNIAASASIFFRGEKAKIKENIGKLKERVKARKEKIIKFINPNYGKRFKVNSSDEESDEENIEIREHKTEEKIEIVKDEAKIEKEVEENKIEPKDKVSNTEESKNLEKIEEDDLLLCPISQELMTDPVMTPYGHCFQRKCIEEWLDSHDTCPLTNNKLLKSQLVTCYTVKAIVDQHLKTSHIILDN